MLLFLHSYTRWSHDRYITAPSSKPNMEQVLSSYLSCPSLLLSMAVNYVQKQENELCSMFVALSGYSVQRGPGR